jgi:hypothetical protein
VAQTTFNRELGAAPTGITRFGQTRTEDGSNVTVSSYRTFAGDGSFPFSDVYELTYGSTGLVTFLLDAGAFAVSGFTVIDSNGVSKGTADAPKMTRRLSSGLSFSGSSGDTASLYVHRTDRSATEYRVQAFIA